jgi:hypothetical protein
VSSYTNTEALIRCWWELTGRSGRERREGGRERREEREGGKRRGGEGRREGGRGRRKKGGEEKRERGKVMPFISLCYTSLVLCTSRLRLSC